MEILSPASNMEHINVAIDGKANAVYGGLKKWNARNKAINFSTEEYNLLIDKLHKNNIKFFLTLNILMLDNEIDEIIYFLKNNKLPDAFIVADIGLILRLNKEFPSIPLHFSTQFGAHNIDDVNYIESLNGKRAILSRELTLDEISKIKDITQIELECFIWGSQCLSFSGLCFFGTLINGGGGNRGKCIITCRDIYSINQEKGHYLYVPDMDCINLISKLDGIECLKIEGRRRPPKEILQVLEQINNKELSKQTVGYLQGIDVRDNNLYQQINIRSKPYMKANQLPSISSNDVLVECENEIPIKFSNEYWKDNVMYLYTEIKKPYSVNKKNLCLDFKIDNRNVIKEILYLNYKGDGYTLMGDNNELINFNVEEFVSYIEKNNRDINIYKIKYQRNNDKQLLINKQVYEKAINYILTDCGRRNFRYENNNIKFEQIYLETNNLKVVDEFVNDNFVKLIYNIETVSQLKEIEKIVEKYDDKIIYKLPLFNWHSEELIEYYKILENKDIMFTRYTQIFLTKNLNFKNRYVDYTVYVWNKETLNYLAKCNINEFTASPELSYNTNYKIFKNVKMQVIFCGKLPLVYTRNCFGHLFECAGCNNTELKKQLKNKDKNLNFEVFCNKDYRYILNSEPILNDYTKVKIHNNVNFRYVSLGQTIEEIKDTIKALKSNNYYEELRKQNFWKNSYECNLLEGKE